MKPTNLAFECDLVLLRYAVTSNLADQSLSIDHMQTSRYTARRVHSNVVG
jgi:hypothetical protein